MATRKARPTRTVASKSKAPKVSSDDLPKKTLEDALRVAKAINDHYAGKQASWEDIARVLGFSPNNSNNRYYLWSASAYGIIVPEEGNRYKLSEIGRKILSPTFEGEDREGIVKAVATPKILAQFFSDYSGSKLPSGDIFKNVLEQKYHVPKNRTDETIQLILSNARYARLLDESNANAFSLRSSNAAVGVGDDSSAARNGSSPHPNYDIPTDGSVDYSNACFIITPIGEDGSPERKHADAILKHLINPVLSETDIKVIRADTIGKPGHITKQVVEHIAFCELCITDLSFGNQNAHYELGIRHALKRPSIQLIRKGDKIPFDIQQGRTIIIDTSDPYTIMDRIASARAELAEHVKALISGSGKAEESPITMYLPKLAVKLS